MNVRYTIMAGCLLMMGLASCEMKDEILGKDGDSSAMGLLNLGVVVDSSSNDVVTKADGTEDSGTITPPAVSAKGYEVEISNNEGLYKTVTYDPENASVELPVGSYTLYAHKQGEPLMTEPYYGGRASCEVTEDATSSVKVICTMVNTKIQLSYDLAMPTSFQNWTITVEPVGMDNISQILQYDNTSSLSQPDPFYWVLDEGVKQIRVSFVGLNNYGKWVRETRLISKPSTAENTDWLGGDALAITMKVGAYDPTDPYGVQGIEISATVTWKDEQEDTVTVPVTDDGGGDTGGDTGNTGGADAPTITGDCIGKELVYVIGSEDRPVVEITMNVPKKIKDVRVQIKTDNPNFAEPLTGMGLMAEGGASLINNEELSSLFELPVEGTETYSFKLSETLFSLMQNLVGTHEFILIVTDQAEPSNEAKASFKIIIEK